MQSYQDRKNVLIKMVNCRRLCPLWSSFLSYTMYGMLACVSSRSGINDVSYAPIIVNVRVVQ
jgi:hypothetical protein